MSYANRWKWVLINMLGSVLLFNLLLNPRVTEGHVIVPIWTVCAAGLVTLLCLERKVGPDA